MRGSDGGAELHPLLVHHIVNSLGWPSLRPLQQAAVPPILQGKHALLAAPTAGGKTEAAVFPVLSRMLSEEWPALSVLYLCPLRALLNNLHPRISGYAQLVGRRAGLWHGDVGQSDREAIRSDPPDILLTTPESIEAMLISSKTDHLSLFRNVRAIVVDEIHAFAGDDRGWHLAAVAERVQRLAGREIQRIGLSATVGNPESILEWVSRTGTSDRVVVSPPTGGARREPEVTLDFVGSLENAAIVISRLHRGEKRLVFVDSRARVEQLAVALRELDVRTFVSHGSLGREERRAAEEAFASSRDCVIVSTSTLELGIDVGDLDRVVQLDAPSTVASFLQRLGRTGRRGDEPSNMLFLATRDEAFLKALGLLLCWEDGFVEPLEPAAMPLHLVVQQLLALVLQERGVGRYTWPEWLGDPFIFGPEIEERLPELATHLLRSDYLFEDNGVLGIGDAGRLTFGGRNFIELMAVFSEPPVLKVMAGRTELGSVPQQILTLEAPDGHRLLLAGRNWYVKSIDWRRGVVYVEPAPDGGRARWLGDGQALSWELCQAMRRILAGVDLQRVRLSERATGRMEMMREEFGWVRSDPETVIVRADGQPLWWWTFAGMKANLWLAGSLGDVIDQTTPDDFRIRLAPSATPEQLQERLERLDLGSLRLGLAVADAAVDRLKFAEALPDAAAREVVEARLRDDTASRWVKDNALRVAVG
ncbi:DEAD/DEAH box helicase [Gemmatimonadota bacterium Y43]|uniref:DEAD/DEAH box helicase n=1 Tax=Gaopeijia maritima TaxID=3119007 RepID=UPI003276DF91